MKNREEFFNNNIRQKLYDTTNIHNIQHIRFEDEEKILQLFNRRDYVGMWELTPTTTRKISLFFYENVTWTYRREYNVFTLCFEDKEELNVQQYEWGYFMAKISLTYCPRRKTLFGTELMINNFFRWCDEQNIKYTKL